MIISQQACDPRFVLYQSHEQQFNASMEISLSLSLLPPPHPPTPTPIPHLLPRACDKRNKTKQSVPTMLCDLVTKAAHFFFSDVISCRRILPEKTTFCALPGAAAPRGASAHQNPNRHWVFACLVFNPPPPPFFSPFCLILGNCSFINQPCFGEGLVSLGPAVPFLTTHFSHPFLFNPCDTV